VLTTTELVTDAAAASSTFTVSVSGGNDAPGFNVGACVQVTTWPAALQLQPVPAAELKVRPAGSVSLTVTMLSSRSMPVTPAVTTARTPAQVSRILDADLWRVRQGGNEEFDVERFGVWIAVLVQAGLEIATEKLAGLQLGLVVAGLSKHLIVRDHGTIAAYVTLDGELIAERPRKAGLGVDIGGYRIEARRTSAWDEIVELLAFMEAEHTEFFHRLMRECVRLSSGPREEDGFHALLQDDEQHMFDTSSDRAARRAVCENRRW